MHLPRAYPRPAVIVGGGAHNVVPSAHATFASVTGEKDVVADDTHDVKGVATAEWLTATLGDDDVNAGGTGVCANDPDDGLSPGFEGRDICASPSSYLLTLHDDVDEVTPLLSVHEVAPSASGSSDCKDLDGVDRGVAHARLYVTHRVTMMTMSRRTPSQNCVTQ